MAARSGHGDVHSARVRRADRICALRGDRLRGDHTRDGRPAACDAACDPAYAWHQPRCERSATVKDERGAGLPASELLSAVGCGAILSFGALLFAERSWTPVWLPFTACATSLAS